MEGEDPQARRPAVSRGHVSSSGGVSRSRRPHRGEPATRGQRTERLLRGDVETFAVGLWVSAFPSNRLLLAVESSVQRTVAPEPIDPVAIYAAAIDTSDYVTSVAPLLRRHASPVGDLLDVGAGGGQLGRALRDADRRWTAIEPTPSMRARLAALDRPPTIMASGWQSAAIGENEFDTVLAANIAAPFEDASGFLARCRAWARRTVVWVLPAQHGPRGMILAGCLPAHWHGEDETPGVDIVVSALSPAEQPHAVATCDWTFRSLVDDLEAISAYLAGRLDWPPDDARRAEIAAHLRRQARPDPRGHRLEIPRTSAILAWSAR
jgi:Methyltransferase domain